MGTETWNAMPERNQMSSEYEKRLEKEIDRELKSLPELQAPRALVPRVMRSIEQQTRVPWYRQSWQMWPVALRAASLIILLAFFAGICVAGWELRQTAIVAGAGHEAAGWIAGLSAIWNVLSVLLGAVALMAKHLGIGFMVACVVAVAIAYAMCFGLGTVYVRLALVRR